MSTRNIVARSRASLAAIDADLASAAATCASSNARHLIGRARALARAADLMLRQAQKMPLAEVVEHGPARSSGAAIGRAAGCV